LDAATPLIAALENIQEDKANLQDATKAMQEALDFLGNTSQHHAVHHRQAILQQLNPQLKSLVKDEDFVDAHPFLFVEQFASVAKEHLEATAVLKKSVCSTKQQGFHKSHLSEVCLGPQGWLILKRPGLQSRSEGTWCGSNSPSGETVHNGSGNSTIDRMAHL